MTCVQRLISAACVVLMFACQVGAAAEALGAAPSTTPAPLLQIGPGDQLKIEVFGNPDLSTTINVTDDGTVRMPLAGPVVVGGQSPAEAAYRIETALKAGEFLVNPQVTVTVIQSLSQRVSVLGEVGKPGRYPIESNSTVFDLLALAGGITPRGSDVVHILRADASGVLQKLTVDLRRTVNSQDTSAAAVMTLRGGDSIEVPKGTFFIGGQVTNPGEYRIEGDMMLYEAIARAGDVTPLGSASRVEVQRRSADGKAVKVKVDKYLRILPGDVIRVKERLF